MVAGQTFPLWVDLVSISVGAMLGALAAIRRQAPIVGIVMVGIVTGLGGGILRDLMLNADVAALEVDIYLPVVLGAILLAMPLQRLIPRTPLQIIVQDQPKCLRIIRSQCGDDFLWDSGLLCFGPDLIKLRVHRGCGESGLRRRDHPLERSFRENW